MEDRDLLCLRGQMALWDGEQWAEPLREKLSPFDQAQKMAQVVVDALGLEAHDIRCTECEAWAPVVEPHTLRHAAGCNAPTITLYRIKPPLQMRIDGLPEDE